MSDYSKPREAACCDCADEVDRLRAEQATIEATALGRELQRDELAAANVVLQNANDSLAREIRILRDVNSL